MNAALRDALHSARLGMDGLHCHHSAAAWMPYKLRTHPVLIYLSAPRVVGYRPPLFRSNWYEYVDVVG